MFLKRNGVVIAQIIPVPKSKFPYGFLKDQVGNVPDDLLFSTSEEEYEDFYKPLDV